MSVILSRRDCLPECSSTDSAHLIAPFSFILVWQGVFLSKVALWVSTWLNGTWGTLQFLWASQKLPMCPLPVISQAQMSSTPPGREIDPPPGKNPYAKPHSGAFLCIPITIQELLTEGWTGSAVFFKEDASYHLHSISERLYSLEHILSVALMPCSQPPFTLTLLSPLYPDSVIAWFLSTWVFNVAIFSC